MNKMISFLALSLVAAATFSACSSGNSMVGGSMSPTMTQASSGTMTPDSTMSGSAMSPDHSMSDAMNSGTFITYDQYASDKMMHSHGPVVLFFNASWCPDCKAITEKLTSDPSSIPSGTTIVSVDYDSHTDLRQRYGVTMQHTFVQIDGDGNALNTWSATTVDDIASGIKA